MFLEARKLKRRSDLYLQDIVEAIDRIIEYTEGITLEEFKKSKIKVDAVMRNLEIIGEVACQLDKEMKDKYKDITWRDIQDFRIVVAHHYWKINIERIWDIVENRLNVLQKQVNDILKNLKK